MSRDTNIENITPETYFEGAIWEILSILRSQRIDPNDYFFILLFVELTRSGWLDSKTFKEFVDIEEFIVHIGKEKNSPYFDHLLSIYRVFEPTISKLDRSIQNSIVDVLEKSQRFLQKNYSELYEKLFAQLLRSQGKMSGFFTQPIELSRFIMKIAQLHSYANIYNPFAGAASFGLFIEENPFEQTSQEYFGQEKIQTAQTIGHLRLIAHGIEDYAKIELGDSIKNWNPKNEKYSLIVANPPFGFKFRDPILGEFGKIRNCEQFVIEKGIQDLDSDGKLIVITSSGFLFRSGEEKKLRKKLIEKDLLEMVISFPGGLLHNTTIPYNVIVISNSKEVKGQVRFINAENFVEKNEKGEKIFNDLLLSTYINSNSKSEHIKVIPNSKIVSYDYNLNVPRYFLKEVEGVQLKDIVTIIKGNRISKVSQGKYIRIRDLKNETFEYYLKSEDIITNNLTPGSQKLDHSCLLLARRWKTLKPTYFIYTGEDVYITPELFAVKVDELKVDIEYIITELNSEFVGDQIRAFSTGSVIPQISIDDLLNIKIRLPELNQQKAKVLGATELSNLLLEVKKERNALAHNLENTIYEIIATMKHSLGKPLLNINSSIQNIDTALTKADKNWKDIMVSKNMNVTVQDSLNSISKNLELIHSILKNNENKLDIDKYELTEVEIIKFIKDYIKALKASKKSNIEIKDIISKDVKREVQNNAHINANEELLEIMFNYIVENAERHAFTDAYAKYKLQINVDIHVESTKDHDNNKTIGQFDSFLKIEFSNDGNPFPKNFNIDKLIRQNTYAGDTGNTGKGGYYINEISKKFKGRFELRLNSEDSEFTTTYILFIPLNKE
jgi:type I restriction enzyme M protein